MFKPNNKQLSEWYLLLSQQLDAGITMAQAIQLTGVLDAASRNDLVRHLEQGVEPAEVFKNYAPWMPPTDIKLITAASASGKLPEVLSGLSVRRIMMHENIQRAIGACIYPIFIVHLAAIVTPIFNLIDINFHTGSFSLHFEHYIPVVLQALAVAWALIIGAALLLRQNNPRVLSLFPVIKEYSLWQAYSDFCALLSAFLKAGATAEVAWREAGRASSDPALRHYADDISLHARQGISPGSAINPKECPFPPEFVSLYVSGEQTGQLDKNMDLLTKLFQEKANLKLKQASEWYPIVIFLCVAVYVGFGLVKFYTSYLDMLMSIIKPN